MRVFVTGASGFIGSAIVSELLNAGHTVVGLARSDESVEKLRAAGAEVHRGSLQDLESLKAGAAACDGVIHAAFIHDFSDYARSAEIDREAVEAMAGALEGSNKPFINTSGTLGISDPSKEISTEAEMGGDQSNIGNERLLTEHVTRSYAARGVRAMVIRLSPSVHGDGDWAFVPWLIRVARETGESGYVGEGASRWPAVHRLDAARLFRLAIEKGEPGDVYHGVADQGIRIKDIAAVIGKRLNIPVVSLSAEEAGKRYGFLGEVMQMDNPTSSAKTREKLGWVPTHSDLLSDLENGTYFDSA